MKEKTMLRIVLTVILFAAIAHPAHASLERPMKNWMKALASAQEQFRDSAQADADGNGRGEYGTLAELSALPSPFVPRSCSKEFLTPEGFGRWRGYLIAVFLPDAAEAREERWVAYAWPEEYGVTGFHTFVVDQEGEVLGADIPRFSGPGNPPPQDLAFDGDPFGNGAFLPEWREADFLPDRSHHFRKAERVFLFGLVFGAILLTAALAGFVAETKRGKTPSIFTLAPGKRTMVATLLIVPVFATAVNELLEYGGCRMLADYEPLYWRATLSLAALFLGLSEAAGRRSFTALFAAAVAFLLLGADMRYIVYGFLNPGADAALLLSLAYGIWFLISMTIAWRQAKEKRGKSMGP